MRMTISKKLYIGIGVLTAVLIGLAIFFQASIKNTKARLIAVQEYPELQALLGSVTIDHFKWAEGLAVGTMMLGKEFKGQIDHTQCNLGKWYYSFNPPKELEDAFKKIEEPHKKFHATAPKIIALMKEKKVDAAKKVYEEETKPNLIATQEALTEMRLGVKKLIDRDITNMKTMQDSMGRTSLIVYVLILGSLISGSVLFLARPIKKNLNNISGWVNTTATGDLTKGVDIHTNDEIGDMASSLKAMLDKVKNVITQTKEASNQVSVAADQIAEANQNFSQRITEQAASVEETSSTMEEMSASIRQTADNAREANKLAQSAKTSAEAGIRVMSDTIDAMDEINKSSSKIANISNVIEEIAFQTNLLALNAAVEAARAGEHGKGFAVVASEIRSLAQRAAQSAKEITGLIEDSVDKTGRGVQLAQELNKKLEEISVGVKKVADLMDEVAASAQEQASGINQVNTAVTQIDQMTQQNAALVEETSASAEELAAQAKELMNLISFFKVGETSVAEKEAGIAKKRVQHLEPKKSVKASQPVLAHALASQSRGIVSAETGGKSNGGFEEF
jgi:methyl-accepting chemotaxis protein